MPFTAVILVWRKPGMSPAAFAEHYETKHIPLIRSLAGNTFPLTHTRHYIQRSEAGNGGSDNSNAAYPAVTIIGDPKDFDYDAYAELVFEDEATFQEFITVLTAPEAAAKLAADEEHFVDRPKSKLVRIGQSLVTRRS